MLIAPCSPRAPGPVSPPEGWKALLELGFEWRPEEGRTVLAHRRHEGPLRVQKALYPEGPALCQVLVLHPPAGIAGGDALTLQVALASGSQALVTTPGAGKWYRSKGPQATQVLDFRVGDGAVLEWLPQETILYDQLNGHTETRVQLGADALYVGLDLLCLGRTASGETLRQGRLGMVARIAQQGRLLWSEQGAIEGGSRLLQSPAGLRGMPVSGTLLVAGRAISNEVLDACRAVVPAVGEGAVTRLPNLLIARYLGPAAEPGRAWFVDLWARLRPALTGREAQVPRIWHT